MAQQDFYEILEVSRSASAAEIKKAYRAKAMKYHPDRNPGDQAAEEQFKACSQAYEVLSNPQKKAQYDQYGHAAYTQSGGQDHGFSGFGSGNFSDIFEEVFGNFMGGGARGAQAQNTGEDVSVDLTLSLKEAFEGTKKEIKYKVAVACDPCKGLGTPTPEGRVTCNTCNGHGMVRMQQGFFMMERGCPECRGQGHQIKDPCKSCRGAGVEEDVKTIQIDIPAGMQDGVRMKVTGGGHAGPNGAPAGDLYAFIHVEDHPIFQREGNDLHAEVPISIVDAVMGTTIQMPLIEGNHENVTIPAGTQHGERIRVKGKGMSIYRNSSRGNLYLHIAVEIPKNLTQRQKDILAQFYESVDAKKNHPSVNGFWEKAKKIWGGQPKDAAAPRKAQKKASKK